MPRPDITSLRWRFPSLTGRGILPLLLGMTLGVTAATVPTPRQLEAWLKRFPKADLNGDGRLTLDEAETYRKRMVSGERSNREVAEKSGGAPREFSVDPGWDESRFPDHAVSKLSPEAIRDLYARQLGGKGNAVVSFPKPDNGAMRIVGTGHSFMQPGYKTLPLITRAAGFEQPLLTHTGGGITGSARYKWEQENGIFQFDRKPVPKLLSSISNAEWDAMMWGPYFNDRPQYYSCWIDFCQKFHPDMKFFLPDAWPQLSQLDFKPKKESELTVEILEKMGREKREGFGQLIEELRGRYGCRIYIMPTSDALVLAAKRFIEGRLPGIQGLHRAVGGKERSLWRDELGHLGPGLERLEGYVFYATLYGRSPVQIQEPIAYQDKSSFPGPELDRIFRELAWEAVIHHPLSGVTDRDADGKADGWK